MELPDINKRKILLILKEEKRLDGRKPLEYRDINIETGVSINAEGSARVKIGKTDVVAGVKLGVQEPYPDSEDEGTLLTTMEFLSICGERYETGPPKIDAIEIARVVDRGIRESGFIDFKKLCIKKGEKVWSVTIDIFCLNDDGNVLDASALAALVALKVAKFPVYDEKNEVIKFGELTSEPLPLVNSKTPITVTFYMVGDNIIIDPTREEEDASEARLTITLTDSKKGKVINALQKGGIESISEKDIYKMLEESQKIYDKLSLKIDKLLK